MPTKILCSVMVVAIVLTNGQAQEVKQQVNAVQGELGAIEQVAGELDSQKTLLRTWRGDVVIKDVRNGIFDKDNGTSVQAVSFVLDQDRKALRWRSILESPLVQVAAKDRRSVVTEGPHVTDRMIKQGQYYESVLQHLLAVERPKRINILPLKDSTVDKSQFNFNPLHPGVYSIRNDLAGFLQFLVRNADEKVDPSMAWHVSVDGSRITLEVPNLGIAYERFDFASDQGFNLVEYENVTRTETSNNAKIVKASYANINNVWVMNKLSLRHEIATASLPKGVTTEREVTWLKSEVNVPISDEEFSWKAMGVKPGDSFVDNLRGIRFQYEATEEVERTLRELTPQGLSNEQGLGIRATEKEKHAKKVEGDGRSSTPSNAASSNSEDKGVAIREGKPRSSAARALSHIALSCILLVAIYAGFKYRRKCAKNMRSQV